jgi:heavy metal efflux system protein
VYAIAPAELNQLPVAALDTSNHPGIRYLADARQLAENLLVLEKKQLLPDLQFSLFSGSNNGADAQRYNGFQAGVGIPLWQKAHRARIAAATTEIAIQQLETEHYQLQLHDKYQALRSELQQHAEEINYYRTTGKALAEETRFHAGKAYQNGEIDFLQYVQLLENAQSIEINYLTSLFQYNHTVLEANYLID